MSKRKNLSLLAGVCILCCAGAVPALAGGSAFVGLSAPTGDFGDAANISYHLGGAYDMPVAPMLSAGVRAAYNRWGWENDVDGNFNAIEALAYGKISTPAGPFGMLGFGLSSSKAEISVPGFPTVESDRQTDFTWALGGGYHFMMVEMTALYHSISTEGTSSNYFTISAGVDF